MAKLTLTRTYTYMGKDYGPGNDVEVPDSIPSGKDLPPLTPADDIKAKEDAYQQYLRDGGEPVAPVTPGIATANQPEGLTSFPLARPHKAPAPAPAPADDKRPAPQGEAEASAPASASSKEKAAKRGEDDKK